MQSNPEIDDTQLARPLGALRGLAQLLACVDPERWNSVGRPAASDLATLVFTIHGELEGELTER